MANRGDTKSVAQEEPLTPYDWQEADIKSIIRDGKGSALVTTAVGGGKTLISVEVAKRMGHQTILVIAPPGTHKRSWMRTIARQHPGAKVARLDSTKRGLAALADLQWGVPGYYLCSAQWFVRRDMKNIKPDLAIFDEIHIAGAYKNVTRKKLHLLKAKCRIGLSGTPLRNHFENAWGIIRWIFPECMPKPFYQWRLTDCETEEDWFAIQHRRVIGELEPGKLVNSLPCYIQHLQRERCCKFHPRGFLDGLEEPEEIVRTVQLSAKMRKFYSSMENHFMAWLTTPDESGNVPVVAELPIVARGMLRFCALGMPSLNEETQKLYFEEGCESPKINELFDILEDMGDETALVYTHSKQFAHEVTRRLNEKNISALEWSGNFSQRVRDKFLEEFIAGEVRVIVAVISAAGTGTDGMQEATSTEIWLSEDDDGTTNEQGRGRVDRPGQKRRVVRIKVQAEGTYDEGIVSKQIEERLRLNAALRKKAA